MKNTLKKYFPKEWATLEKNSGLSQEKLEVYFTKKGQEAFGLEDKEAVDRLNLILAKRFGLGRLLVLLGGRAGKFLAFYRHESPALTVCQLGEVLWKLKDPTSLSQARLTDVYLYARRVVRKEYYLQGPKDLDYYFLPQEVEACLPQPKLNPVQGSQPRAYQLKGERAWFAPGPQKEEALAEVQGLVKETYSWVEETKVLALEKKGPGWTVVLSFQGTQPLEGQPWDQVLVEHWQAQKGNGLEMTMLFEP